MWRILTLDDAGEFRLDGGEGAGGALGCTKGNDTFLDNFLKTKKTMMNMIRAATVIVLLQNSSR
jgi:hypothetical protein